MYTVSLRDAPLNISRTDATTGPTRRGHLMLRRGSSSGLRIRSPQPCHRTARPARYLTYPRNRPFLYILGLTLRGQTSLRTLTTVVALAAPVAARAVLSHISTDHARRFESVASDFEAADGFADGFAEGQRGAASGHSSSDSGQEVAAPRPGWRVVPGAQVRAEESSPRSRRRAWRGRSNARRVAERWATQFGRRRSRSKENLGCDLGSWKSREAHPRSHPV